MSDQEDAAHEWMHSIHTAVLKAEAENLLGQRRAMLISQCAASTDYKIVYAYGEYVRALAVKDLLEKGSL